ncbi:MAG: S41 family peptidase [Bdellovibrionaceae bacterium]|nr:S41 family peptidase [Pseudobdellovibrionaceae bacterium]NUM57649.1 S41 family peptidase [Pseudobdellovibrionaceae bacterium]
MNHKGLIKTIKQWKLSIFLLGVFSILMVGAQEKYSELQNFSKVLNLIQQYYVEEVDVKKLIQGAIKGMLKELDPHTSYMTADVFKEFENETSGEFAGLGIEMSIQNGILTIISPIEDTPAWIAGVKAGDKVIAIDGKSTRGLSLMDASQLIRGKNGTKVVLKIVREKNNDPIDISIIRGQVKIKSVKYTDLEDGFGYVRITSFIENTAKDLEKALEKHTEKNKKIEGLIIDLRKNPGGLLDQAIKISDMFLNEGIIVSTIGRNKAEKEISYASKKGKYKDFPLIILVNEYSASASEIVSGALQDNKRALIVGERTFGKGSVQSIVKLPDGSGLKLTVARYYTPKGVSIQAEGIKPDIEIEDVETETFSKSLVKQKGTREKDIQGHLKGEREKNNVSVDDEKESSNSPLAWWNNVASSKEDNLSPKQKLFKTDYQVYQAFNYLKTWKVLKFMNK